MAVEALAVGTFILASAKFSYDVVKIYLDEKSGRKRKAGIRKLYVALSATTDYLEHTKNLTSDRDPDIERRLDKLWRETASAVETMDRQLAQRLYLKADYWRNPDRYGKSKTAKKEIDQARIELIDIRGEILKFL